MPRKLGYGGVLVHDFIGDSGQMIWMAAVWTSLHLTCFSRSLVVVSRVCQPSLSGSFKHLVSECLDTLFHMSMLALVGMLPTFRVDPGGVTVEVLMTDY